MPLIKKKKVKTTKKATTVSKKTRKPRTARLRPQKPFFAIRKTSPEQHPVRLERYEKNPIITPSVDRPWESKATFNPGAIFAADKVHILYRAIGEGDISVLGYASSSDGISIDERIEGPVFAAESSERKTELKAAVPAVPYSSGGGWSGGCEDPRVTLIDDTVYLIYTAFDGWGSVRLALSSIALDDLLHKRWNWKKPALISPQGEIHKNWVLFPEKINGKFAILHSISPDILIDYFDTLEDFDGAENVVKSRYARSLREGRWDYWIRGAGPPPLKTKHGWLLFYHAMDKRDPDRYKLGVMMLDLHDPTKVLYRSKNPILEPDEYYENHGFKGGVIYSCGAVVMGQDLFVYYGGADAVVCVATAKLEPFLEDLESHETPKLAITTKKKNQNA